MNFFRVYHHKKKGYYAAPVGFNIQAAILMFLWAAANNLWSKALLLFVLVAGMLGVIIYGNQANMQMLMYVGIAGISIAPIWSGISANEWIFKSLESQGYTLVRKIRAKDAKTAINNAHKGSSGSSKGRKRSSNSKLDQNKDTELPINAEPEWRKRRNNRMIK